MTSSVEHSAGTIEIRLADLVWRTIKIRAVLLAILLGAIFVTWSAIESGRQKQAQIDSDFRAQQADYLRRAEAVVGKAVVQPLEDQLAKTDQLSLFLETERRTLELFAPSLDSDQKADPKVAAGRNFFHDWLGQLREYDDKRRRAFSMQISLPYLKQEITLNALTVADVWPFFALGVLLVVLTLGFQQRNYEVILSYERSKSGSRAERARALALSEFFGGEISKTRIDGREVLFYERRIALYPETFVTWGLVALVVWLSVDLGAAYNPTLFHRTDSILFSYFSALWGVVVLCSCLMWLTWSYYRGELETAVGFPVISRWGHYFGHESGATESHHSGGRQSRLRRTAKGLDVIVVAALGLSSLAFPWTKPPLVFRGLRFLLTQTPISSVSGIKLFPIDPYVFREMRVQVWIASAFLFASFAAGLLFWRYGTPWADPRALFRRIFAWLILLLSTNFAFYLLILRYQSYRDITLPILDLLLSPRGLDSPRGFPLLMYNPTWEFAVFFGACLYAALDCIQDRRRSR